MHPIIAFIATVIIWYLTIFRFTYNMLGKDMNSIILWIINLMAFVTLWTMLKSKLETL